jgi:hypothetical protein
MHLVFHLTLYAAEKGLIKRSLEIQMNWLVLLIFKYLLVVEK